MGRRKLKLRSRHPLQRKMMTMTMTSRGSRVCRDGEAGAGDRGRDLGIRGHQSLGWRMAVSLARL